uniref:Uncharacterized protein n=1 Tax=Nelumbo nucifera TaxID=4432 RepID=A0A822ZKP3_NELNU|nr:TPA_asm: hypothetical protein HUJ06_003687 [Nelumbo nucifera]
MAQRNPQCLDAFGRIFDICWIEPNGGSRGSKFGVWFLKNSGAGDDGKERLRQRFTGKYSSKTVPFLFLDFRHWVAKSKERPYEL